MKQKFPTNTIGITKELINYYVKEGQVVLDATVGKGYDLLQLAKRVGENGRVYGFDIQAIAIEHTRDLLVKENLDQRAILINDNHENIDKYIKVNLDFIVYNLGYLPGGDKMITTEAASTVKSLEKSFNMLNKNGILLISSYIGHPGGREEKQAIEALLVSLEQKQFNVLKNEFINQINNPPILYIVEKII